jgi:deoxyribose-phosphate aldolase
MNKRSNGMTLTKAELAAYFDHSILRPNVSAAEIDAGVELAGEAGCASVCISPCHLDRARAILKGSKTILGTVIGFPFGTHTAVSKANETMDAYARGSREMDMVMNISALINGEYDRVLEDISSVVKATPAPVKVILENCYLSKEQIVKACCLVEEAGAQYVKTSTGFGKSGAVIEDVILMRKSVSEKIKVKAAGGISSLADCYAMIEAGADRIGTSRTKTILGELS